MKTGFTTTILHSDLESPIEHFRSTSRCTSRPPTATPTRHDLARVFKGEMPGYSYGRQGNPTATALESKVTKMEQGVGTVVFSTGIAAIACTFLALLRAGDHVVSSSFLFGNTNSLFATFDTLGCDVSFVDATDVENVKRAIRPETRIVFVETIANPRTQIADLARIGELCTERGLIYIVDNTLTSPYLYLPKRHGPALVMQFADEVHRRSR